MTQLMMNVFLCFSVQINTAQMTTGFVIDSSQVLRSDMLFQPLILSDFSYALQFCCV